MVFELEHHFYSMWFFQNPICNLGIHLPGQSTDQQYIIRITSAAFLSSSYIIQPCQSVDEENLRQGNVAHDLWKRRASPLLLALRVMHEGMGSKVLAQLSARQSQGGCDWCEDVWGSSPTLSIMRLYRKCDAFWCKYTQHANTSKTFTHVRFLSLNWVCLS